MEEIRSHQELCTALATLADDECREFVMKICPSERPFLGVRVPQIRDIAKRVAPDKIEELISAVPVGYEETLARAFLIARLPYDKMLKYFDSQVDCLDDWSTCDTFCSAIHRLLKRHKTEFFEMKIEELLRDTREFAVRTGLVLLKSEYVEPDYLNVIFDRVESLKGREEYYIKMGIAWLLCDCFIKYPDITTSYLSVSKLPVWTFNKTISKICDSYRVEPDAKEMLRKMRR